VRQHDQYRSQEIRSEDLAAVDHRGSKQQAAPNRSPAQQQHGPPDRAAIEHQLDEDEKAADELLGTFYTLYRTVKGRACDRRPSDRGKFIDMVTHYGRDDVGTAIPLFLASADLEIIGNRGHPIGWLANNIARLLATLDERPATHWCDHPEPKCTNWTQHTQRIVEDGRAERAQVVTVGRH